MSAYKHKLDIVSRTKEILDALSDIKYEKTLVLNCSLGLLIIPQQAGKKNKAIEVDGEITYEEWGIDPRKIKGQKKSKSIKEIANHFRNSLAHGKFDIVDCNGDTIEFVHIRDYDPPYDEESQVPNFEITLNFSDYKRFIAKYAKELEAKLTSL
ncbi:MAG: hypothetical protein IJK32_02785 [Bacteroidales bacterium]|nr:hypothetical protein [Bacteroidales bacterium]